MASYTLRDATDTEVDHIAGSLAITTSVNRRGQLRFSTVTIDTGTPGDLPFEVGEAVYVEDDSTARIFGGTVDRIEEGDLTVGDRTHRTARYTVVDFDQLAERRLVAASYESKTLSYIVNDLITNYLTDEGVTAGTIETGPTFAKVVFNYRSCASCLDDLAELTGFSWWIDPALALQFRDRAAITAPWAITAVSRPYRRLRIHRTRYQYRNAQYVRAGTDLADSAAEIFEGDGTRRTFNVSLPFGAVPTVEVDTGSGYATKTVGVNGVDASKAFYYNIGRTEITQSSGETVLATTHNLRVTYQGQIPIIVLAEDPDEQAARATAEGIGSGKYESIVDAPEIDDDELALDRALAQLRRYGQVPVELDIDTDTTGLEAGQLLSVTLPDHDLTGTWLIESVTAQARQDNDLRYSVRALSGEAFGGWQEYFRRQREARRTYVIRENETLIILRSPADGLAIADSPTTATSTSSGFTVDAAGAIVGLVDVG